MVSFQQPWGAKTFACRSDCSIQGSEACGQKHERTVMERPQNGISLSVQKFVPPLHLMFKHFILVKF